MDKLAGTVQSIKQASSNLAEPDQFIRFNKSLKRWFAPITETSLPFFDFYPFDCLPDCEIRKSSGSRCVKENGRQINSAHPLRGYKKASSARSDHNNARLNFSGAEKSLTASLKVNRQNQSSGSDKNVTEVVKQVLNVPTAKIKASLANINGRSLEQLISELSPINNINRLTAPEAYRQILDNSNIIDRVLKDNKIEEKKTGKRPASKIRNAIVKQLSSQIDVADRLEPEQDIFDETYRDSSTNIESSLNRSLKKIDILSNNILNKYRQTEQKSFSSNKREVLRSIPETRAMNILDKKQALSFIESGSLKEAVDLSSRRTTIEPERSDEPVKESFESSHNTTLITEEQKLSVRDKGRYEPNNDQEDIISLVNKDLIKQAKRHGVDLS